jgi:hypothetical protein
LQRVSPEVIEKRQQSCQAANPSNQINGAMKMLGDLLGGSAGLTSLGRSDGTAGRG